MTTEQLTNFALRDYQIEGVERLRTDKRLMLTDAPGVGKTPQAAFAAVSPTLVVCPNYLVSQWAEKLVEYGFSKVAVAVGSRAERIKALEDFDADFVICNVEMLGNYHCFEESRWIHHWRTVIFDESHHLKAHNGKRARIAVALAKYAEYVYLLTATPVKKEIDDYFMQFRILQPDIFSSYWRFVNMFCNTEQSYFGVQILGAKKSMLPELRRILSVITFGRSYEDIGRELPPIIEKYVTVELNPETRKLYNTAINFWRVEDEDERISFTSYMAIMHILRQILTGGLKTQEVKDIVEDSIGQCVIFSWYKNTAEAIQKALGDSCVLVTGDVPVAERRRLALSGKHVSATISALNEGIDLSSARNVIFAEEDFTPGSNYQALARVHRERQGGNNSEPVIVTYVHCHKTIDEEIHAVAKGRSATVNEIVKRSLYL